MKKAHRLLVAALVTSLLYVSLLQSDWTVRFVDWVDRAGTLGVVVFSAAYVLFTLLLLPGSILTLGAGFLYGPVAGTLLVSPISVLGATLAFVLAKGWARAWVEARIESSPRFAAVDRAILERGFVTVFLLRLSPAFPFSLMNYALGLTRVRLGSYVSASFLGMLPGTFLYVYLGSLLRSVAELRAGAPAEASPARQWLLWGGLVATALLTFVIARASRRALEKSLATKF